MKLRAHARWIGVGIIGTLLGVGCGSSTSGEGEAGGTSGTAASGATSAGGAHGGSAGKTGTASGGTTSGGSANHGGSAGTSGSESAGSSAGGSVSGGTSGGGTSAAGATAGGAAGASGSAAGEAGATSEGGTSGSDGACTPGEEQCVSLTQVESCGADGQWGAPRDCEFGCNGDACANNYALTFDGSNDIVTVPFASDLDVTNALTIEAWVYAVSANGGGIASMWGEGGLADKFLVQLTGGNVVGRIPTTSGQATVSATMPLNSWTHVAFTYDGSTMLLYLNGVQAGSNDVAGALPKENLPFRLGIEDVNLGVHTFLSGNLDEVRFWNVVRSAAEIAANYQASISPTSAGLVAYWNFNEAQSSQTVNDITAHGNNGTLGANASVASDDPVRAAR